MEHCCPYARRWRVRCDGYPQPGARRRPQSPDQVSTAAPLFDGSADGSHATLFIGDSQSEWELARCEALDKLESGPDCADPSVFRGLGGARVYPVAPQPGGTTTFQLLLVRQGGAYLLYANVAYLCAYHDDTGPADSGGAAGLYLDPFSQSARFTDLAVYPAVSGLPFWAR